MNAAEQRIVHLEQLIAADEAAIANLQNQVAALNQAQRTGQASSPGAGGGGGSTYWCHSPGIAAATGSWPTLTPSSGTADVYQDVAGTLTLFKASQTIRWFYKDASTAGKLMAVTSCADGNWDGLLDSCTGV